MLQREPYPETARVRQAPEGATYLKSIAGDGAGGFLAVFENDGKETPLHFSETTRLAESRYPGITHYFLLREDADTFQYFWPWTAVAGVPGFDYLDLYGWSTGRRGTEYSGYSTIGLRTPVQNLTIGTATYTGTMTAEIWASDDSQWGTQVAIHGTSFLAADLDGGRITGNVDGLRVGPVFGDRDAYKTLAKSNRIEISGTMQKDGSFTADWNGQGPETDVETSMTMRGFTGTAIGDLYGPAGEEIGGVLSGTRGVTGTLPEQFIIGAIGASRDDL